MWKNNVCSIMEEISLCVTVHGHIKGGPNNWSTFITLPTKQMASQVWLKRKTSIQRLLLQTQSMMKSITRVNNDTRNYERKSILNVNGKQKPIFEI